MAPANPVFHRVSRTAARVLALQLELKTPLGQREQAERLGVSVVTVNRAVAQLVQAGLLERQRRDAGWRGHLADKLTVTAAGRDWLTGLHSGSRALPSKSKAAALPTSARVLALREAMRAAGLTAGFGNLYPEVEAELDAKVADVGVATMVRAAQAATWGAVRHVAAYLRHWRALRKPRPRTCAFHPQQPPTGCAECAQQRAAAVRMPEWVRHAVRARPRPLLCS